MSIAAVLIRLISLVVLLFIATFITAHAADPPSDPILRIETGGHTSVIRRIATDAAGRWLVTASNDHTARVWDLSNGRLLLTIRPPIFGSSESKLQAVALSPDGQIVALGGVTGSQGDRTITLHDRATGHLLRRIGNLPESIAHLTFSYDGRLLAASLHQNGGIRLFSSHDGRLLSEDTSYDASSFSVDFSRDGRLVATSYDGFLRLYRLEGERLLTITKKSVPGGKKPLTARFSPDGRYIAVGFSDTPAVTVVLNGENLEIVVTPDMAGVDRPLWSVAWSREGNALFAAGDATRGGQRFIRRWPVDGHEIGSSQDWPSGTTNSIQDLATLPEGRLAFGGSGEWGTLSARGERLLFRAPETADFRETQQGFLLSSDGTRVRFGYELWGKSPVVFDSQRRSLLTDSSSATDELMPPKLVAPEINVTDWKFTYSTHSPKLNGTPLVLRLNERSRSLAVLPSGAGFALGTEFNLRAFDRNGNSLWSKSSPGVTWAVNVSADGRWVVAAYGDGTIRWHRVSDGVEQLAFFPHPDRKRWVLWSPSGYYDASPGAEDLIGWHLNRGKDNVADFFPASRFRSKYHRPDVLTKVLETADESRAIQLADTEAGRRTQTTAVSQVLPPVVEIITPLTDTTVLETTVTIRYRTRSPDDAPITVIRLRVNGQAVSLPDVRVLTDKSAKKDKDSDWQEVKVTIPPQDSEIQLFAENKNGVSVPATLRVTWAGARPPEKDEMTIKPKLYVLAVGVSKYAIQNLNLGLAAKDASDFVNAFQQQNGKLYADVQVKLLTDAKATKDEMLDGLDWLKREVTARDVGVMFLAGHGVNDNTGKYYFLPHNADPQKLLRTGVSQTDIRDTLNSLAGKVVFFVDTCHSGNALGTSRTRTMGNTTDAFVNELASAENGVVVFTAATGRQLSQENEAWGNGAFTKAVVEGLQGKADFKKTGRITHKALDYYVAERVKDLTKGSQSPTAIAPLGVVDFPLAVVGR